MVFGGGGEIFFLFKDARHPRLAADFVKFLTSRENSAHFSRKVGTISAVLGATRKEDVSPALASALEIMERAHGSFRTRVESLYLHWAGSVLPEALAQLLKGEISPQEFGEVLEKGMQDVRDDPDIYKPPPMELMTFERESTR